MDELSLVFFAEQFDVMGTCNQENLCGQWTFLVKIKKTFTFLAPITWEGDGVGREESLLCVVLLPFRLTNHHFHTLPLQSPGV